VGEESERFTVLSAELAVAREALRIKRVAYSEAKVAAEEQENIVRALELLLARTAGEVGK